MFRAFPLKSRLLYRISGADAPKFLKRMTTRNVESLQLGNPISSLILNSSGKILMDLVLWKDAPHSIICEVDAILASRFQKHLTKYAIRQDVVIEPLKDWNIFVHNADSKLASKLKDSAAGYTSGFITFKDPRCEALGDRVWTTENIIQSSPPSNDFMKDEYQYYVNRCLQGIPEGYFDLLFEKSVPWESNFDVFQAVDLGFCFVGQELTARSFHTGVFRKRMLPLQAIDSNNNFIDIQDYNPTKLLPKHGETIRAEGVSGRLGRMGRMGSSMGPIGLGVVKTKEAIEGTTFIGEDSGLRFKAIIPDWLPEVEKIRAEREQL